MRKEIILFTLLLAPPRLCELQQATSAPAAVQCASYDGVVGSYATGGSRRSTAAAARTIEFPAESIVSVAFRRGGIQNHNVEIIRTAVLKATAPRHMACIVSTL